MEPPELSRCPFNKAHVMHQANLQRHVLRCMKNYPTWLSCPYNALHRFPDTESLAQHMTICSNRESIYTVMLTEYQSRGRESSDKQVPVHIEGTRDINLSEENWDKEYERD